MKKIIFMMTALLIAASINISNAQSVEDNTAQEEKLSKKERKALEKAEMKKKLIALVEDQSFVLQADALYDRYRNRYNATANNFIMFEGDRMVLQTSFPGGIGYNGLGGVTLDGRVIDYDIKTPKNKSISITAQVSGTLFGHGTLTMNIGSSGYADATFSDNWGNRISFSGRIEGLDDSYVYEGMSI